MPARTRSTPGRQKPSRSRGGASSPAEVAVGDTLVAGVRLAELLSANGTSAGPRSKLAAILDIATARFGESGYETTKWSTVADEVGIGQTALYHYFESKAHCLLTIMRLELARSLERFLLATAGATSNSAAVEAALLATFQVSDAEVSQLRILTANGDILGTPRMAEREEIERAKCLALTHEIERCWTDLVAGKLAGAPDDTRDARMLALAVLGMINSVWRWYRRAGKLSLTEVSDIFISSANRVLD